MTVLVTGHDGYIGSELMTQLSNMGQDVTGYDIETDPQTDIRDSDQLRQTVQESNPDRIYHLAAEADVWVDDWQHLVETNVMGTVNVAAAAKDTPVIVASSVAAQGTFNRYGRSKSLAEQTLEEYPHAHPIRFPNVIGGNAPRGQAQAMIEQGLDGEIEVWANGTIERSYIDVVDLCTFLRDIDTSTPPQAIHSHSTTNEQLGKQIQTVIKQETGHRPTLSLVDRTPPSPQKLTASGKQISDPKPLIESIRSQVQATIN